MSPRPCEECGALVAPSDYCADGLCADCAAERARLSAPIYHALAEE